MFTGVTQNLEETADAFKKMQISLLVFTAVAAVGILIASIAIFKQTK